MGRRSKKSEEPKRKVNFLIFQLSYFFFYSLKNRQTYAKKNQS